MNWRMPLRRREFAGTWHRVDWLATNRVGTLVRGAVGAAIFAGGLYIYIVVQGIAKPEATSASAWDALIPFVPEMMIAYLAFFPFVVAAAFASDHTRFRRVVLASVIAAAIGWTCFLLFPASLERPDPTSVANPQLRALFVWLHSIDASHNTFPSLHVAITWIATLSFRETRAFVPAFAVAATICASTLFVKQHTLLDVLAGTVVAVVAIGACAGMSRFGRFSDGRTRP